MNQTLHIFAKDARRFWPEIVISEVLLAAFAYVLTLSNGELAQLDPSFVLYSILETIFYVLIPISWWVLTSRVVHEENLVGNRQFWITRPYRWPSLLAAKLLFLFAFILVPIGLAQAAILSATGFHVASFAPGIGFGVLLFGILVILPLAALSAVTPSFAKLTVTMLGIVLAVLIFGSLIVPRAALNFGVTPHASRPYILLTLTGCAAIVLLQYARRRTTVSRVVLAVLILLLVVWPMFFSTLLMPLYFHAGATSAENEEVVHLDPAKQLGISGIQMQGRDESEVISVPVVFSGGVPDSVAAVEAIKIEVSTNTGLTFNGPWHSLGQSVYRSGGSDRLQLPLPKSFVERVKSTPVSVRLTVGVTEFKAEGTTTIPFPSGKTAIPGIGICSGSRSPLSHDTSSYNLMCTAPLRMSAYTYATARWSDVPCEKSQPPINQLIPGDAYTGSFDSDPAEYGLSPLVQQQITFSNGNVPLPNNGNRQRYLCAGTPLTFTRYHILRRTATKLRMQGINLAALPSMMPDALQFEMLENPRQ